MSALQQCFTPTLRSLGKKVVCGVVAVLILLLPPVHLSHANILDSFGKFGIKDEHELGRKFSVLVKSRMPIIQDPEIVRYANYVLDRLQENIPPQPFPFEINVIVDNKLNAFAVPGGYVFVNTGMLLELEHESELAGVLAHELAHVTQRHIANRINNAQKVQMISLLGMVAGAVLGATSSGNAGSGLLTGSLAAGQAAMLNYSREDEREADQIGLLYLADAGYNPHGLPSSFEKIRKRKWESGSNVPTYLSTHPDIEERQDYLSGRVASLPQAVQQRPDNDEQFQHIQTLVRARYTAPESALAYFSQREETPLVLMGKAIALSRSNNIQAATAMFDAALKADPKNALILREAGRFHYTKGTTNKAIFLLQKATVRNPEDLMTLFFYARLLNEQGDHNTAATYYEKILKTLPEDSEVHFFYGKLLGQNGDEFSGHLHLAYSALYRNDKKKSAYHIKKAEALAKTQEQEEAITLIKHQRKERAAYWNK